MRIVFMGTPAFATPSLERLYSDGHDVAAVFTQPDKPRNRGMKVSYSAVKEVAMVQGTQIYQPDSLKGSEAADAIRSLSCDLLVVVAYGKLLRRNILDLPPFGCINIHGSLLPKYRGAAPIQWAILNGETETGLTSMFIEEELDAGDMLLDVKTQIGEDETAGELQSRLSLLGAKLLSDTIAAIESGTAVRIPQDHAEATHAPMLDKSYSPIDWTQSAISIKQKVRALNPWPIATADFNGVVYKIFSVDVVESTQSGKMPGEIVEAGPQGLKVACSDAIVSIKELQAPGGKRMQAADYLKGNKI